MKKKVSGFTLIEVMAALAIVAITFAVILNFESYLLTSTKRGTNRVQRTGAMINFLYECYSKPNEESEKDNQKKRTKKIDQPELTLTYTQKTIPKGSDLDEYENLVLDTVQAEWPRPKGGGTLKDRVIAIRFAMKEQEKEKKGQAQ